MRVLQRIYHHRHIIHIFIIAIAITNLIPFLGQKIIFWSSYSGFLLSHPTIENQQSNATIQIICQQLAHRLLVIENTTTCASRADLLDYANITDLNSTCSPNIWAAIKLKENHTLLIRKPVSLLPQSSRKSFKISRRDSWLPRLELYYDSFTLEYNKPKQKRKIDTDNAICIQEKGLLKYQQ